MALVQYQNLTDLLLPSLWATIHHKGGTVVDANIVGERDFARDENVIRLSVVHELLRWPANELLHDGARHHLLVERMKKALMVKGSDAKIIGLHRRRMMARGHEARKLKSRVRIK